MVENSKKYPRQKNSNKNNKGFLKGKGYEPEEITTPDFRKQKGDLAHDKPQYTIGPTKAPRPEVTPSDEEEKKPKRMKAAKELLQPETKDPKLKSAYLFRYFLIALSILILLIGFFISYQNYTEISTKSYSLEESGYNLMLELRNYDGLKLDPDYGYAAWDANKYLTITSEDIRSDLAPEVEFYIEVQDLSAYSINYNRTEDNNLAWSSVKLSQIPGDSADDKFTITTFLNIYVSADEVHLAKVTLTVWEK